MTFHYVTNMTSICDWIRSNDIVIFKHSKDIRNLSKMLYNISG